VIHRAVIQTGRSSWSGTEIRQYMDGHFLPTFVTVAAAMCLSSLLVLPVLVIYVVRLRYVISYKAEDLLPYLISCGH
jgi:hypothetical protein